MKDTPRKGVVLGLSAHLMWGLFPLYFRLLRGVDPLDVVAHRILWSLVLTVGLVAVLRGRAFLRILSRGSVAVHAVSALLVSTNWLVYIRGVEQGRVVECSLGYFINPLVSVLLGVVFLRERLRPAQWGALGLAFLAVVWLSVRTGSVPWLGLTLAFSFGTYGLVKKSARAPSLDGLCLETAILSPLALFWCLHLAAGGREAFVAGSAATRMLLAGTGIATTIPLLLFGAAATRVRLSTLGLLQYLTPTLQFLVGVFVFREPFDRARLVGFSLVWIALALVAAESVLHARQVQPGRAPIFPSPKP